MINNEKFKELETIIKYEFKDINLLILALNGKKINNNKGKNNQTLMNESLSLLGDAILRMVVTEYYYDESKNDKQYINDKVTSHVNNENLLKIRQKLSIENFIHNESYFYNKAPEQNRPALKTDHDPYVEAIIGAIYKDAGYCKVKEWILDIFGI